MIDSISVLKRNGNAGELRIGESITIDDKLDANTLFCEQPRLIQEDFRRSLRLGH